MAKMNWNWYEEYGEWRSRTFSIHSIDGQVRGEVSQESTQSWKAALSWKPLQTDQTLAEPGEPLRGNRVWRDIEERFADENAAKAGVEHLADTLIGAS